MGVISVPAKVFSPNVQDALFRMFLYCDCSGYSATEWTGRAAK